MKRRSAQPKTIAAALVVILRFSLFATLLAALFVTLLATCSRNEPRIAFYYMSVNYYRTEGRPYARLTFLALPEDDDGIEDIEELQLYNDSEGLVWSFTEETWLVVKDDDKTWIGNYDIAMPDDGSLPGGQYRAVIIDKSGEKSERSFGFEIDDDRHPFPLFSIDLAAGTYTIQTTYPDLYFLCYDQQGNNTSTVPVSIKEGTISGLNLNSSIRSVALWAEDKEYFCSALTEIVPIK
jgi:hypothetical protein